MDQEQGGGDFPGPRMDAEREKEHLEWVRRHVIHLWSNGLLGGVVMAAGATMAWLAFYVTGGILQPGWGGSVVIAGLAGGAVGWMLAWWEDKGGWEG